MASQEISIKWKDHKTEIIEEQNSLFENSAECDCILISAQGKQILAHQVILSSSSDFFRNILCDMPPLVEPVAIHLPDADTFILEAILKFIYTGETDISSAHLTTLLEFCNFLNIKGCVANGFTLNDSNVKTGNDVESQKEAQILGLNKACNSSSESWSSEEYLEVSQNSDDDEGTEPDYLEEYLDDDPLMDEKNGQELIDNDSDDGKNDIGATGDCFEFEIKNSLENIEAKPDPDAVQPTKRQRNRHGTRSTSSQIDKALNEVNTGKTIHRLSVEYNLPRSTLYHRFRNNENLKQNYRSERKSSLDSAVRAVIEERLSLKIAADRFKVPKTAIWREVRKCEQYQPSLKEITEERQKAQREILCGKSLTSISAKYGNILIK